MMALSDGRQRTATESQKLIDAAGLILWQQIIQNSVMGVSVIECRRA
jgi:hypothetical protein